MMPLLTSIHRGTTHCSAVHSNHSGTTAPAVTIMSRTLALSTGMNVRLTIIQYTKAYNDTAITVLKDTAACISLAEDACSYKGPSL